MRSVRLRKYEQRIALENIGEKRIMFTKQDAFRIIEDKKDLFTSLSDSIWEYAELSLMEYKSAALYIKLLRQEGFEVEENIAGISTAFLGRYGSGKPEIGILAEFDALSGLSQEGCSVVRGEIPSQNGVGHGCGHNLLGAGSFAAAVAIKEYLRARGEGSGTVIFYGCPGEEGCSSKAYMAREGMFYPLDAALTWHPGDVNEVTSGTNNSSIEIEYKFTGIAAHAAGNPHLGRSALDAVEIMNIGVQFLREHMVDSARIHYAITDAGGNSPNVVQPAAQVLYMVRSNKVAEAIELRKRVDAIAAAAAMMTETTLSKRRFIDGTANLVPNYALEELFYKNFTAVELPSYTKEEWEFAAALKETYKNFSKANLPGFGTARDASIAKFVREKSENGVRPINDFVMPLFHSNEMQMGSTDVGDVSWQTPTAQIRTATFASGSPGHSWQNASAGKSPFAHKGMLLAGKVIAATAIDIFEDPSLLKTARAEFEEKTAEGYTCPIEPDAVATAVGGKM